MTKRVLLLSEPRSGATLLMELLRCHHQISVHDGEPLNNENLDSVHLFGGDVVAFLDKCYRQTATLKKGASVCVLKITLDQLAEHRVPLNDILNALDINHVLVNYRRSVVDRLVSLRIAEMSGVWYEDVRDTDEPRHDVFPLHLSPADAVAYSRASLYAWLAAGRVWPPAVVPLFVCYEDLISDFGESMHRIWKALSLSSAGVELAVSSKKQNPKPLEEKVENLKEVLAALSLGLIQDTSLSSEGCTVTGLDAGERNTTGTASYQSPLVVANVEAWISKCIDITVAVHPAHLRPSREPPAPPGGFLYRVAVPYMPPEAIENGFDALSGHSVSSATHWVQKLSELLCERFRVPVAQPCCNGFSSLVLALQASGIGPGDSVVVPSMTMVAVSNAVVFVGARPLFADNKPGDYNPGLREVMASIAAYAATSTATAQSAQSPSQTANLVNPQVSTSLRIRAVIVSHTYGCPAQDIFELKQYCHDHNMKLIEDISECLGVAVRRDDEWVMLGSIGDFACSSLYANKTLHGGDAGFVLAADARTKPLLRSLVNHGFTGSFHFVHLRTATNCKINGVGAAIAVGLFKQENFERVMDHRMRLAQLYRKELQAVPVDLLELMPRCGERDTPWVFGGMLKTTKLRTDLRAYLASVGIETRDFFLPLHIQPCNATFNKTLTTPALPQAEECGSRGVYFPTHSMLRDDDIKFICAHISQFFANQCPTSTSVPRASQTGRSLLAAPPAPPKLFAVHVPLSTLYPEVHTYDRAGQRDSLTGTGHHALDAIPLHYDLRAYFRQTSFGDRTRLVQELRAFEKACQASQGGNLPVSDADHWHTTDHTKAYLAEVRKTFAVFLEYLTSSPQPEVPLSRPWIGRAELLPEINLSRTNDWDLRVNGIDTTSEVGVLDLLVWLVQERKSMAVLEVGAWSGGASLLLAAALEAVHGSVDGGAARLCAIDTFEYSTCKMLAGGAKPPDCTAQKSYLATYLGNTASFSQRIVAVACNIGGPEQDTSTEQLQHTVSSDCDKDGEGLASTCGDQLDADKRAQSMHDVAQLLRSQWSSQHQFDVVYFDFTRSYSEMAFAFDCLEPLLADGCIVVVNEFGNPAAPGVVQFVHSKRAHLFPSHKPVDCMALAFQYKRHPGSDSVHQPVPVCTSASDLANTVSSMADKHSQPLLEPVDTRKLATEQTSVRVPGCLAPGTTKLNFVGDPDWDHHHQNAFQAAINELKTRLHDALAPVLFLPSVETFAADCNLSGWDTPWTGVVHSSPRMADQVYVPELERLCHDDRYAIFLRHCMGLFTLTQVQADYLKHNLPTELRARIPIQVLVYPFVIPQDGLPSWSLKHRGAKSRKLCLIGGYNRDYDRFCKLTVPEDFELVVINPPAHVQHLLSDSVACLPRLSSEEYEELLTTEIPALLVLPETDGFASTLVLECIARNTPVLVSRKSSVIEYLGEDYPMFIPEGSEDVTPYLADHVLNAASQYLRRMDKARFSVEYFCASVLKSSCVMSIQALAADSGAPRPPRMCDAMSLPAISALEVGRVFDVSVCVCSWRRTHNLPVLLATLWESQDFSGRVEILVWNNNSDRATEVDRICRPYLRTVDVSRSMRVFHSSSNMYCSVRLSMAPLMRSDKLLICDDDIEPTKSFIGFYMAAARTYPEDVLCVRGNYFLQLTSMTQPTYEGLVSSLENYESVRFVGDGEDEQLIHFAHADACLIPRRRLRQACSLEVPFPEVTLVDDYWLSFVLNHYFATNIRKLKVDKMQPPLHRTKDSDEVSLALYTRPEVRLARQRLFLHHLGCGWPVWPDVRRARLAAAAAMKTASVLPTVVLPSVISGGHAEKAAKSAWIESTAFGVNIDLRISEADIVGLAELGIDLVRVGAVHLGEAHDFVFCNDVQRAKLPELLCRLRTHGIRVIITLDPRVATAQHWRTIARVGRAFDNVVGYDLINEPVVASEVAENGPQASELADRVLDQEEYDAYFLRFAGLIGAVREEDETTPILLETSFWANISMVRPLMVAFAKFRNQNSTVARRFEGTVISVHFYDPVALTLRQARMGPKLAFPGDIPLYPGPSRAATGPFVRWDGERVAQDVAIAAAAARDSGFGFVIGEFGCSRFVPGVSAYLESVATAAARARVPCILYAFREVSYDRMNYELGCAETNRTILPTNDPDNVLSSLVGALRRLPAVSK